RGGAHGELVEVGRADDRRAGSAQAVDDLGVLVVLGQVEPGLRAAGPRGSGDGDVVLDRDDLPGERACGGGGLGPRRLGVDVHEGAEAPFALVDRGEDLLEAAGHAVANLPRTRASTPASRSANIRW